MCVCIADLFSPLHLMDSAFHIIQLHSNIRFLFSPLFQAGGAPQRRAVPAAPFPKSTRGNIKNISRKPTAYIIRRLSVPRPKERDSGT